jgi:hypothetical protein
MKTLSAAVASALGTTVLLGAVHVLHAQSQSFAPGETLTASKMNASFAGLSNRIDALEKANAIPAVPPGTIMAFGGPNVPEGWLPCDGTSLDRVAEPALFAAIGAAWGAADETKFNVPDLRGFFLRGVSGAVPRDPDRDARTAIAPGGNAGNLVGSVQGSEVFKHHHNTSSYGIALVCVQGGGACLYVSSGAQGFDSTDVGGNETRPLNANVLYIIKR